MREVEVVLEVDVYFGEVEGRFRRSIDGFGEMVVVLGVVDVNLREIKDVLGEPGLMNLEEVEVESEKSRN